jgi:hypothetical protein
MQYGEISQFEVDSGNSISHQIQSHTNVRDGDS